MHDIQDILSLEGFAKKKTRKRNFYNLSYIIKYYISYLNESTNDVMQKNMLLHNVW